MKPSGAEQISELQSGSKWWEYFDLYKLWLNGPVLQSASLP